MNLIIENDGKSAQQKPLSVVVFSFRHPYEVRNGLHCCEEGAYYQGGADPQWDSAWLKEEACSWINKVNGMKKEKEKKIILKRE